MTPKALLLFALILMHNDIKVLSSKVGLEIRNRISGPLESYCKGLAEKDALVHPEFSYVGTDKGEKTDVSLRNDVCFLNTEKGRSILDGLLAIDNLAWFEDKEYHSEGVVTFRQGTFLERVPGVWKLLFFNVTTTSDYFQQNFEEEKTQNSIVPMLKDEKLSSVKMPGQLVLMSFNLRYGTANDGSNSWPFRRQQVFDLLLKYGADVVGLQEALLFQLEEIEAAIGPSYTWVGAGRDDGISQGEYSAILYNKDKLRLLETNTFWFCDRPSEPGCRTYGNTLPRVFTYARFWSFSENFSFYVYNLHLDHLSQVSRERSIEQLLSFMKTRSFPHFPAIVTGDFNNGERSPEIMMLKKNGFDDTFRVLHPEDLEVCTFHGFQGACNGDKIDYVFLESRFSSNETITEAGIVRDNVNGKYPSDHFPVLAKLDMRRIVTKRN